MRRSASTKGPLSLGSADACRSNRSNRFGSDCGHVRFPESGSMAAIGRPPVGPADREGRKAEVAERPL